MAKTKRRTAATRRKKKKPSRIWIWITLLNLVLFGVSAWLLLGKKVILELPQLGSSSSTLPLVEGVLVASGVKLSADLETYSVSEGIHHWKVHLNRQQRDAVLSSLKHLESEQLFNLNIGPERIIKGKPLQLVTFEEAGKPLLKLILARKVPAKKKPEPEPPPIEAEPTIEPAPSDYWETSQGAKIAIIIDDVGMKPVSQIQDLLDLQVPITFAVLPYQRYSENTASNLYNSHYEVILHMPMEPTNFPVTNPGAGAVFSTYSHAQTKAALNEALDSISHVRGVNNHMGSKITALPDKMASIMEVLKDRNLYFVDSRTHASTVAYDIAQRSKVPSAKRDVFLDATMSYEFSRDQLLETAKVARENGFAIAIGHPYPSTIAAMVDVIPQLKNQGFAFVFASQLTGVPASY